MGSSFRQGRGVWDGSHRRLTAGLLLVVSISAFEAMAVATVLPDVAADLGRGDLSWYGWVFSGFMLASLVGIPAAGVMSDRRGAARPLVAGGALFITGLLASGFASSMPWLVAGRIVQGFGAGALGSVAYAAVAREYDAVGQARMLSLLATAWVLPGLVGPAAAVALAALYGWRSVFLALVPLSAAAAALACSGLHARNPASTGEGPAPSMRPALRLAAGCALAMAAMETANLLVALCCALAGFALAAPALHGMLPAGTLTARRGAPAALAAKTLVTVAFFGVEAFLPLALTSVRGESIAVAGAVLTAGTLSWTSGAWLQEKLGPRFGRPVVLTSALVLVAAATAGAAGVLVAPNPALLAAASWCAAGLGIGAAYSATTLAVFEGTPKGGEGDAGAAVQLANVLGTALGTGLGGAVLSMVTGAGGSRAWGIAAVDALMLAAVLAALAASRRIPAPASRPG